MLEDLRFALRQLRKSPGFTSLVLITLALGIGMNTTIFSLIHQLFLRGLPFNEPSRIVRVYGEAKERNLQQLPFGVPRFWHYRDNQQVFSEMAADTGTGYILTGQGDPIQLNGALVTANYFQLLGGRPILGRLFLPEEEEGADVALISEHFWRSRLGSDPAVLGRALNLNGIATTVVGVIPTMPVSWFGLDCEIWTTKPFTPPGLEKELIMRGVSFLRAIGRLKPGVTVEQVRAALPAVQESYRQLNAEKADSGWTPVVVTAPEDATGNLRPAFLTLLAAVCFVLLIACSNVANLLLVRFTGRRREIALRVALGASRGGIVRLFVLESTLMSMFAGLLGLGLTTWAMPIIPKLAGQNVPLEATSAINWPVLLFTFGLSILTGVAMGSYPAWQSSRSDLTEGLKESGRSMSGTPGQHRIRRGLVAVQVGLSVVLLTGAALLITSFLRLSRQEAGFRTERVWSGGVGLPPARYADEKARARFFEQMQAELQTAPGVEAVTLSDNIPLTGNGSRAPYARADNNPPPINQRPLGNMHSISPGYLRTFGIPLVAGRDFDQRDSNDRPSVVLISQATAKRLFPGENPVGRQMFFGTNNGTGLLTEIVGVVGDIRFDRLDRLDEVEFYRPISQRVFPFANVIVRSSLVPAAIGQTVREALRKIDAELPIIQPTMMDDVARQSIGQQRLTMTLLALFAGVALLLAMIGIYGAVAYTVEQRTGEIGVRMALGAQARDVLRLVVSQGMKPVFIGLAVGVLAAFALSRLIKAQLYEVSAHNPGLLAATAFILTTAALLACFVPARRASQLNPIEALRTE
jgi:predicted permease